MALGDEFDVMSTPVIVEDWTINRRAGIVYEGLTW
jgi:hypothetical protein